MNAFPNSRWCLLTLVALLMAGCQSGNESPEVLYERASIQWTRGNFEDAIGLFDKAIAAAPDRAEAYFRRADSYRKLGLHDQAVQDFDACLERDPGNRDALNDKGICQAESQQFEAAMATFTQLIDADDSDSLALRNRGLCLFDLGRYEDALVDYERARQRNGEDAETWFQMGNALLQLDRLPEAIEHYTTAIQHRPEYARAWMNRGLARYQLGERAAGMAELQRASELDPGIVIPPIDWTSDDVPGEVVVAAKPIVPAVEAWSLIEAAAVGYLQSAGYEDCTVDAVLRSHQCGRITATRGNTRVQIYVGIASLEADTTRIPGPVEEGPSALLILAPEANATQPEDVGVLHFEPQWQPDDVRPLLLEVQVP